ncbi:MAG: VWA domain-containing protein [Acidobacteria bacterium]|nr:VWA domain-containing protein [Acidobacteriota bacterium]
MFKTLFSTLFFSLVIGFSSASAQTPQPSPGQPGDNEVVKITTSLIRLDVVVRDKDGKQITDLKSGDFQVYQDGKLQTVTSLSYIDPNKSDNADLSREKIKPGKREPLAPPANIRSKQGRIVTFVLDDGNCLATVTGTAAIRDGMRKFVREQMLPDDKVAVYRTRGGASLLQMYTSNRDILLKKIDKITLMPTGSCGSSFEPIRDKSTIKFTGKGAESFESEADKKFRTDNEKNERENQVIGTIGVLRFVVERLRNVPQRKIVFLLSEGISADIKTRAGDALRELADKASRASVVINTMSAKGVTAPGMLMAQDEVLPGILNGNDMAVQAVEDRVEEERALNQGLSYLAYATGGKFVRNENFLDVGLKKILDAETGYYLIGYEPDDETFRGKQFHRIEVKVGRPDTSVASRKGFYGRTEKESQPVYKTADSPLFQAISSPFEESGMDIRLTTVFGNTASKGSYLRAFFHVDGRDLSLIDENNGGKKTVLDVVAVILDEKGAVVDEFNRSYPIRIPKQGVATVQQYGLDFSTDIPFKKAGLYTFRLAVRDNNSKRLGSAGDFVEIPDVEKTRFLVSGLTAYGTDPAGNPVVPKQQPVNAAFSPVFTESVASLRRFPRNSVLYYNYTIYNSKLDTAGKASLARELRLYRDGKLLVSFPEQPLKPSSDADPKRIEDRGVVRINGDIEPGEYVLQIIVRDKLDNKVSSQWIDFEVMD